jgi:hypothetical protein
LKEKWFVHFSKRTHTMTARVQKIKKPNEQAMINTQSTLSTKTKIKSKEIKSFQMKKKMIIQTNKQMRKNQALNFQPNHWFLN